MNISFTLNNKKVTWNLEPDQRVREVLYAHGCVTVRDSDDGEGRISCPVSSLKELISGLPNR